MKKIFYISRKLVNVLVVLLFLLTSFSNLNAENLTLDNIVGVSNTSSNRRNEYEKIGTNLNKDYYRNDISYRYRFFGAILNPPQMNAHRNHKIPVENSQIMSSSQVRLQANQSELQGQLELVHH